MRNREENGVAPDGSKGSRINLDDPSAEEPVLRLVSRLAPHLQYYLYVPRGVAVRRRVLVTVHGVSRNAEEQIQLFRRQADRYGVVLMAPVFSRESFRDYQRLGRRGRGPRADLALIRELNSIGMRLDIDVSRVNMFGFSGGAQFAHRFAFAHPQRLGHLVLGAAGWYTMPDKSVAYPMGIGEPRGLGAVSFNSAMISRLRAQVIVGQEDDRSDDEELNRSEAVCRVQGENRVQRARAWTRAMNALAERYDGLEGVEISLLPGVGHSFSQAVSEGGLAERVFKFCYESTGLNVPSRAPQFETGGRGVRLSDYRIRWMREGVGR